MNILITIGLLWIAWVIVMYLHELGHGGKKIRIKWGIIPEGASIEAKWRLGGLAVNLLLAYLIFYFKPEQILLQYIGLLAWIHLILYLILGSFNKEISRKRLVLLNYRYPKAMKNFFKRHVFDDVPNELWYIFVPAGIAVFWWMKDFYLPILGGVFG